jgi:SsrA-binding protein
MAKKQKDKSESNTSLILRNKKAFHDYEVLEKLECGIVLQGTEVKSLRNGKVNLNQAFCTIENGNLVIHGMNISTYEMGNYMNHEPECKRRLLAHKREIKKLSHRVEQKGFSLVPLRLYWKSGRCKVEIGVVRGKKLFDKRNTVKEKDLTRQIERQIKFR